MAEQFGSQQQFMPEISGLNNMFSPSSGPSLDTFMPQNNVAPDPGYGWTPAPQDFNNFVPQDYQHDMSGYEFNAGMPNNNELSWLEKNSRGQLGVDNAFRLGQMGLSGLGMAANIRGQKNKQQAFQRAMDMLGSNSDPNTGLYRSELARLMGSPNAYLEDTATQRRIQSTRDALLRKARLEGRNELSASELEMLNGVAQEDMYKRAEFLNKLIDREDRLNAARANIMSQDPGRNDLAAVLPGLSGMFNVGQEYAVSQNMASDPRTRVAGSKLQSDNRAVQEFIQRLPLELQGPVSQSYSTTLGPTL